MSDLISRQAAIKAVDEALTRVFVEHRDIAEKMINKIPCAQPERKKGRWIEHEWAEIIEGNLVSNYECSQCHEWAKEKTDYCPNCGADMKGSDDEYEETVRV